MVTRSEGDRGLRRLKLGNHLIHNRACGYPTPLRLEERHPHAAGGRFSASPGPLVELLWRLSGLVVPPLESGPVNPGLLRAAPRAPDKPNVVTRDCRKAHSSRGTERRLRSRETFVASFPFFTRRKYPWTAQFLSPSFCAKTVNSAR